MKILESLNYFLQKCNARRLSVNTLDSYKFHLTPFVEFAISKGITDIEDVKENLILLYLQQLSVDYSPYTIRGRYIYLKIFFNRLVDAGVLYDNPAKGINLPKKKKTIIYSFSKGEIIDILNGFDKSTFVGVRDYTIMNVLFGTGIRKSELLGITLYDVLDDRDFIRILGKGGKERLVPVSDKLKMVLAKYLRAREKLMKERNKYGSYLFVADNGNRLTASGVNSLFKRLKECKKHWSTRVSAHTCRHTFAKLFLLNGGDIFTLQRILGHEDISTTRVYIDLNDTELKMQNDKFNPLDNHRWQYQ